jgi:hypothetical protein
MNWIRKAPTALLVTIVIVCGLGVIVTIGGFVLLAYAGRDTDDYRAFVSVLIQAATLAVAGVGAVGGVSAARSASNTEENTNGTLHAKDSEIAELQRQVRLAEQRARLARGLEP